MVPEQAYETPVFDTITATVETSTSEGFLTKLSSLFSFDNFVNKLDLTRERCIEIALYCSIGFVIGFLCKKYNFYLFLFVVSVLIIVGLNYFDFITFTVHVDKINSFIGYQLVPSDTTFFTSCLHWIKEHIHASISFMVGFILGILVA